MERLIPVLMVAIAFTAGVVTGALGEIPGADDDPATDPATGQGDGKDPKKEPRHDPGAGDDVGVITPDPGDDGGDGVVTRPPPDDGRKGGEQPLPFAALSCASPLQLTTQVTPQRVRSGDTLNVTVQLHNPTDAPANVTPRSLESTLYQLTNDGLYRAHVSSRATYPSDTGTWTVPANGSLPLDPKYVGASGPVRLDEAHAPGLYVYGLSLRADGDTMCGYVVFEYMGTAR